ncbi:hypothetical protein MPH_13167 [Macrophomina phaseolina MS6]|uniref:Uncharacterized protein n=1 Tax=Macrophomina phaseolina (strain MS6) TaxID=1126212 RepID=K2RHY2_MACPH|nr:hypothetical protein MPH_13167 [Macrophomina phaseolina MS6]
MHLLRGGVIMRVENAVQRQAGSVPSQAQALDSTRQHLFCCSGDPGSRYGEQGRAGHETGTSCVQCNSAPSRPFCYTPRGHLISLHGTLASRVEPSHAQEHAKDQHSRVLPRPDSSRPAANPPDYGPRPTLPGRMQAGSRSCRNRILLISRRWRQCQRMK